ncbi:MAG: flagellar biosynthetic protein FliO [Chromatocurvus sp.]
MRPRPAVFALAVSVASAPALAQRAERVAPELFSAGYLAQVLGSLVLVVLCLVGVIFLLRRVNRIGQSGGAPLRVLGSASVGTREKVVLLAAGGEQLLLGVAPGSVRTLHVFAEPVIDEAALSRTSGHDFASVLRSANPLSGGR